jgi:hypothetical protein
MRSRSLSTVTEPSSGYQASSLADKFHIRGTTATTTTTSTTSTISTTTKTGTTADTPPAIRLSGVPKHLTLKPLRKGVRFSIAPSKAAALAVTLLATTKTPRSHRRLS